jgi:hypothetical protein
MLSESTEQFLDSTTTKDNSMPAFSTTAHGLFSQQIRNHPCKKSVVEKQQAKTLHLHSQESITALKNKKIPYYQISENGLPNI